ncbi:MAG: DUF2974 domain-containing protein [Lachnospiraceae bacterium]|nr:DUF2974 domain-containing protein [Lachnospiraceae bacterium]
MGMLEYLSWRGDLTLDAFPLNEVDGMVFSRLVYAPFDLVLGKGDIGEYGGAVPKIYIDDVSDDENGVDEEVPAVQPVDEEVPAVQPADEGDPAGKQAWSMPEKTSMAGLRLLRDVLEEILNTDGFREHLLDPQDEALIRVVKDSIRYEELCVSDFIDFISEDEESQFCGMTLHIGGNLNIVVFRGTDDTFLGWKENFNMGFVNPLGCQLHGLNYLNIVAAELKGDLVLCGHSKGGNIACFAGAFCDSDIQSRITDIFSYDSPGYMDSVLESEGYGRICDRIHTFVPQSSLIAMILGHKEPFIIIHSIDNQVFHQHNLFTWEVEKDHLVRENDTTDASKVFDNSLKNWLDVMEQQKRIRFVDGMYALVTQMKLKKLSDVKKIPVPERVRQTLDAMKTLDPETRAVITEGIRLMFTSYNKSRNTLVHKAGK